MEPVGMVSTLRSSASASVMRITAQYWAFSEGLFDLRQRQFEGFLAVAGVGEPFTLVTVLVDVPFI